MKHSNIALFVPHIGCTHKCSFCNQNVITGHTDIPHSQDVINAVETSLKYHTENTELAFFGGSFTAIDRDYMNELLDSAQPYLKSGRIDGIRISTRPDYIDEEILTLLKEKGVTSIELGAQSMDDEVLLKNMRGHTAQDVIKSSKLIKEYGFSLGLQMMTGLYKSTPEKDIYTAKLLCSLKPDTMRIYPTVILKNTYLEKLYRDGKYVPYGFDESVELCARLLDFFESNDVRVIRLGLHDSESLKKDYIAGAYHPAFKELCISKLFYKSIIKALAENGVTGDIEIYVNPKDVSALVGNKRENINKLRVAGYNATVIQDIGLEKYTLKISQKGQECSAFKIFGNTRL